MKTIGPIGGMSWESNARVLMVRSIGLSKPTPYTFDTVHRMQPWPYGDKPVYVLSRSLAQLPQECPPSVRLVQGGPTDAVAQAAAQGHHSLYVDGGLTIRAFLAAGLVSELIITVIPVLLGTGRPLFGPLPRDTGLRLVSSQAFEFGFVQSHYAVAREA